MLLVDSGGQYLGGTTDVTRTIVLGEISDEIKMHYTLVAVGDAAADGCEIFIRVYGKESGYPGQAAPLE